MNRAATQSIQLKCEVLWRALNWHGLWVFEKLGFNRTLERLFAILSKGYSLDHQHTILVMQYQELCR
ncbi:hypothetical protein LINGRAHAP2_LOCUS16063 [Linum grandiflorum]